MSALGYSEEGGQVVLRMTPADWETLLMLIGYGPHSPIFASPEHALAFANRINAGNPNYTPYGIAP